MEMLRIAPRPKDIIWAQMYADPPLKDGPVGECETQDVNYTAVKLD
jgi:hypothetical protein